MKRRLLEDYAHAGQNEQLNQHSFNSLAVWEELSLPLSLGVKQIIHFVLRFSSLEIIQLIIADRSLIPLEPFTENEASWCQLGF